MGVKIANISPALADELRLEASAEGVVVLDVAQRLDWRRVSASSAAT